jgi:DNA-binding transcriptional ArsR family regulator
MKLQSPLPQEAYLKNANIYKILANSKRLEILNILKLRETAVEELLKITKLSSGPHLQLWESAFYLVPRVQFYA